MNPLIPCVGAFCLTAIITPLIIRLAKRCKCLDAPGGRHLHKKATPRWGGVAFFAGVLPFLFLENGGGLTSYIIASCLLVGMGAIDDLASLGWKTKFAGMAAAATVVICGGQITVHHIGHFGYVAGGDLGWLSIPLTYVSIIGITNAINLLDGLDGLAGGVSLLGFLFMGIVALLAGTTMVAVICFAFVGALAAFLLYNFPTAKIFMGDSGSLFLGFSLAITAILLTQGAPSAADTMFPVLLLLVPIFDTLRVLIVRLLSGRNPFHADNLHLHYLMVRNNISPVHVTLLFWSITAIFGGIALSLTHGTSVSFLVAVIIAAVALSLFAAKLTQGAQNRGECCHDAPFPAAAAFVRNSISYRGFARKGSLLSLKWVVVLGVVVLGVVFLPAQMLSGEMMVLKPERIKSSGADPPGSANVKALGGGTLVTAGCRIIEYPDHYEAECVGNAVQTPAVQTIENGQNPKREQTVASDQPPDAAPADVVPESIVRNELARSHGAAWLKKRSGQ